MTEGLPIEKRERHVPDTARFLSMIKDDVLDVLEDPEERALLERISQGEATALSLEDERRLDDILERFETKIFEYEKQTAEPDAKRVLVTSNDPGSWNAIKPLISALEQDSRCKGIITMVSGIAGRDFKKTFSSFDQVRGDKTMLGDAIALTEKDPIDVAIGSVSVRNGPENLALFGGKGNLGAAKTYFIFEGYGGFGGAFNLGTTEQMEQIDGIFCNDEFAKAIIHKVQPEYPVEKIHAAGMLASEGFELDKAEEYRAETRTKLDIGKNDFAVLYIGDVSSDYAKMPGADPEINTRTFEKTLESIKTLAQEENERKIALIVRPHPRDPEKERLVNAGALGTLPENLSVKNGSNPVPFNGGVYASDVVMSIISTENFFAPARGRRSIFLAYSDEPGFGGQALLSAYGPKLIKAIEQMPGVYIAHTPAELTEILAHISKEPLPEPIGFGAATTTILDKVLK